MQDPVQILDQRMSLPLKGLKGRSPSLQSKPSQKVCRKGKGKGDRQTARPSYPKMSDATHHLIRLLLTRIFFIPFKFQVASSTWHIRQRRKANKEYPRSSSKNSSPTTTTKHCISLIVDILQNSPTNIIQLGF